VPGGERQTTLFDAVAATILSRIVVCPSRRLHPIPASRGHPSRAGRGKTNDALRCSGRDNPVADRRLPVETALPRPACGGPPLPPLPGGERQTAIFDAVAATILSRIAVCPPGRPHPVPASRGHPSRAGRGTANDNGVGRRYPALAGPHARQDCRAHFRSVGPLPFRASTSVPKQPHPAPGCWPPYSFFTYVLSARTYLNPSFSYNLTAGTRNGWVCRMHGSASNALK